MNDGDSVGLAVTGAGPFGYDTDFCAWSGEQARRLRLLRVPGLDVENIGEEIESLGRRDRRELRSRFLVLLAHLLECSVQPELRGPSWRATMFVQRKEIARLLSDSPSLRPSVGAVVEE